MGSSSPNGLRNRFDRNDISSKSSSVAEESASASEKMDLDDVLVVDYTKDENFMKKYKVALTVALLMCAVRIHQI